MPYSGGSSYPRETIMAKRYTINLINTERSELERLTRTGKTAAWKARNARALLLCDSSEGQSPWPIAKIAEALGVTERTVTNIEKRFVEGGLEGALERKQRETPPREIRFDGAFDARLMQLACSSAPKGRRRWTMRLLSEKVVELNMASSCSASTVCRSLKKTSCSRIVAGTGTYPQSTAAVS